MSPMNGVNGPISEPEFLVDPGDLVDSAADITNRLTGAEKSRLFEAAQICNFGPGETLFRQGEPHEGIHIIKSGQIKSLYSSVEGKEFTLGYWPPGHFVGAPQVLGGGENLWTSVAEQQSMTLFIESQRLQKLVLEIPNLALGLIDGLAYKAALYAKIAQIVGTAPIATRLAVLLLCLSGYEPGQKVGDFKIPGFHSQEQLATMVGSTRQAVAHVLTRFEKDGLISRNKNTIVITDIETLEAMAK